MRETSNSNSDSTVYRKAFFDFHNHASVRDMCSAYDPEKWADKLANAGVRASSIFVKCGLGYSYYRKGEYGIMHPQLPAGVDMVEEQVDAFHRRGIKATGYYYTYSSNILPKEHPEWLFINEAGNPDGNPELSGYAMCLVGPFKEQFMIPQIREIVSLYDLDGMFFDGTFAKGICYCDDCRRRYKTDTGYELVPSDEPEVRRKYNDWRLAEYRKLRIDICNVIHEVKPDLEVSFNASYVPRQPEIVPDEVDTLMIDVYPYDQLFQGSYHAACFALTGKQFEIMNTAFLDWWGDWGCKPAAAMQLEVAPVLAYGGIPWPGFQMSYDYSVPDAVMGEFNKLFDFVEKREGLVKDTDQVPFAAVLIDTTQHQLGDHFKEPYDSFLDERRFHAIHRFMQEAMLPHHFVTEDILERRMDEFKVIVLSDQRLISMAMVEQLTEWVEAGGVLIATELSGIKNGLHKLLGVNVEAEYPHSHGYVEVKEDKLSAGTLSMPHLVKSSFHIVSVDNDVNTLAELRSLYIRDDSRYLRLFSPPNGNIVGPAISLRNYGKGKAVYFAGDLFSGYACKNQWNLKHIMANLLEWLIAGELPIRVDSPVWLETIPTRKTDNSGAVIHLINHHGSYYDNDQVRFLEKALPVEGITLRLRLDREPARVSSGPEDSCCGWKYTDGMLEVSGIKVEIHNALIIDYK